MGPVDGTQCILEEWEELWIGLDGVRKQCVLVRKLDIRALECIRRNTFKDMMDITGRLINSCCEEYNRNTHLEIVWVLL